MPETRRRADLPSRAIPDWVGVHHIEPAERRLQRAKSGTSRRADGMEATSHGGSWDTIVRAGIPVVQVAGVRVEVGNSA